MAIAGISSAGFHAASQQAMQTQSAHKPSVQRFHSNTDIDAAGSSVATPASSTGKIGSKVDMTA
jgi:hypothetical protein